MPKQIIRVRLKNAPEFTFAANLSTAVIKQHAVERITVAPE